MLNWLIVGGGIHGTYLSLVLTKTCGVSVDKIRVLDPEDQALAGWMRNTQNTGMTYLRSPMVHHIDLAPGSLKKFSKKWGERKVSIAPYDRPKLSMFNAHCRHVIEHHGLEDLRVQARAERIVLHQKHVTVETDRGAINARRIIMAVGSAPPKVPGWAEALRRQGTPVSHLFDPDFCSDCIPVEGSTVVVGAGISAAQFALKMLDRGAENPVVVSKKAPQVRQFDSDPGWLGPKCMSRFSKETDFDRRRVLITRARYRGSMPGDVFHRLEKQRRSNRILWLKGEVSRARAEDGVAELLVNGHTLSADRVVLATGFEHAPPCHGLIEDLAKEQNLRRSVCGFPQTDRFLRWHPRLFMAGALGELTLGPAGRNIAGARRAGNILTGLLKRS